MGIKGRKRGVHKGIHYKYGLTPQQYAKILEAQEFRCLICMSQTHSLCKRLAVDHDHKTGRVRGLLCQSCNLGLGHFKDDPILMGRAIAYLKYASIGYLNALLGKE